MDVIGNDSSISNSLTLGAGSLEEEVEGYKEAQKRELYYKSGAGRRKIKSIFDSLGINN